MTVWLRLLILFAVILRHRFSKMVYTHGGFKTFIQRKCPFLARRSVVSTEIFTIFLENSYENALSEEFLLHGAP